MVKRLALSSLCSALLGIMLVLALAACDAGPVVVVATPIPLDGGFHTYRHPTGVFSLRLPSDWAVRDVSHGNIVRVEFSPPGTTGLPMTIYVVNTGAILDAASFLDAINHYQSAVNGDASVYSETSRTAQGDGSWRLVGVRQTSIGPREMNTFLQADKTFLSAIEVDLTSVDAATLQTFQAVINTFRVDPTAIIGASQIQAPDDAGNVIQAAGALAFNAMNTWTDAQGDFIIDAQVTNQSGGPLEAVRVTAILYDAQSNPVAQQGTVLPVEVLPDKQAASFAIHFRGGKPSQTVRYELQGAARNAEYSVKSYLGNDSFLVANDKATYNNQGFLTVAGDIVNKTQGPAHFVKVTVTIFDPDLNVVATDNAFLSKPDLLPGEPGHFEVTFYEIGGSAGRYVVNVEGKSDATN